ncbi:MAG TPA: dihydropteroate synthase [Xanthomonadales bacterium]|nr:dihydropteroate synthase [Xanthomonadales bacterium]
MNFAGRILNLDRPLIMGVLNTTPDSFSDGGRWLDLGRALTHALDMVAAGADIIDIGGESTRPGSDPVSADEELSRVIPLLERLRVESDVPVSVDTSKAQVMREAVRAGAGMINDVYALQSEGALAAAAELQVPVCLMHMGGSPRTMQLAPAYDDVVEAVTSFLRGRIVASEEAGVASKAIVLDPGFGFGKTLQHNMELFQAIPRLCALGYPLLVGISRKSMLGQIAGKPAQQRMPASIVAAVLAARQGAAILRVHDVGETADALKVAAALAPR